MLGFSILNYFFPPFEPEELFDEPLDVLDGLLPLLPPEGLPVVLGAFFNPLDFDIIIFVLNYTYFYL